MWGTHRWTIFGTPCHRARLLVVVHAKGCCPICDKCQRFAPSIHQPAAGLNPIASPWPFSQWGLDIVGPLPRAPGNCQWLIVTMDYFTKWVEAEPLVHITDANSKKFVWKNIITRFGIPRVLMSDNGSQFISGPFKEFYEQYGIRNHFSTPAYP